MWKAEELRAILTECPCHRLGKVLQDTVQTLVNEHSGGRGGGGGLGPSWANAAVGANVSRGKFLGGNGSRGRHVRSFTR
ncbi:unnamed protein product [Ranitomeya imitator]|uniref:Uncharacterized protein n=1 Tax=Ranitomeya imitator TaxID=111125 RepID=A0ABN9M2Y7_9NEOB|nr:unnamed protein product [Ranitomeya imitator]